MIVAGLDLSSSPDHVGLFELKGDCVVHFYDEDLYRKIVETGQLNLHRFMLLAARPRMSKRGFYRYRGKLKREFGL